MVRTTAVVACLLLAACQKPAQAIKEERADALIEQIKADAINNRLTRLENNAIPDYAAMRPGKTGWQWVNSRGLQIRVDIDKVAASGNGSKVDLAVLNPMSVGLADCSVSVFWVETDAAGVGIPNTRHHDVMRLKETLPPGDFAFPSLILEDIPPAKLGIVTVEDLMCLRLIRK